MINYSLTDTCAFNGGEHNGSRSHNNTHYRVNIVSIFPFSICIFGFLGNGMVIWLLGFRIKRNPFTTYVLNLAVADLGLLTTTIIRTIIYFLTKISLRKNYIFDYLFRIIYISMYSASQYLLTVISMDRCVSVFFPLWYRCHRPTQLSAIVCSLTWVVSILPPAIYFILGIVEVGSHDYARIQLLVNSFFCLPFMTISSLTLFIKVCYKSKQQKRGKLLTTILITVFFFLLFSFPLNTLPMWYVLIHREFNYFYLAIFSACLNSSVNPLIYYLVGRPKKGRSNRSIKAALQKLFKEEEI